MAEFQEVMRQFDRMCKANAGCYNCPLHEPDGISDNCSIGAFVNGSERIEREVMDWAAEHPEPVYPTWEEWLTDMGVFEPLSSNPNMIQKNVGQVQLNGIPVYAMPTTKVFVPIPADIAEKLGIQPKEG